MCNVTLLVKRGEKKEEYPVLPPRLGTPERTEWEQTVQEMMTQEAELV